MKREIFRVSGVSVIFRSMDQKQLGRPEKLTPEISGKICEGIAGGLSYKDAARIAGISERTFHRWKAAAGKAKRGKYRKFWDALHLAESEGRARLARVLYECAEGERPSRITEKTAADGTITRETIFEPARFALAILNARSADWNQARPRIDKGNIHGGDKGNADTHS